MKHRDTVVSIIKAFEGVPIPQTLRGIAPHECPECDALAQAILNRPFYSLSAEDVDSFYESLPLLSPEALHHYLPAWLLRALENPDGLVMEFTIYHLSPSNKDNLERKEYFEERFAVFDKEQRKAIASFLRDIEEYQLWEGYEGELERAKTIWSD